jgi:hypothetical protein
MGLHHYRLGWLAGDGQSDWMYKGKTDGKHDRVFDNKQPFFEHVERNQWMCLMYGDN